MRWFVLLAFFSMLIGCGGDDGDAAGSAAKQRLELLGMRQYSQIWDTLHPAHQQIVSRTTFVACGEALDPQPTPYQEIKVRSVAGKQVDVPEVGTVSAQHVLLDVTPSSGEVKHYSDDFVKVDGEWRWFLPQQALDTYRNGGCPAGG